MNGIELILQDHERVGVLFDQFAESGDGSYVGQILDMLSAHDSAERAALYPMALAVLDDSSLLERFDEGHRRVHALMEDVRCQEGPALLAAVEALRGEVGEHVRDEESHLLPALKRRATAAQLQTLGARIEQNKQRVG